MFKRMLDSDKMSTLQESGLYLDHLLPDSRKGEVFPAIRNNRLDFYHGGGKLFKYTGSFSTHIKYASVLFHDDDYITEEGLGEAEVIPDFISGYQRIKENCSQYAGIEADYIARLLKRFSYLKPDDIIILDIEASFLSLDSDSKKSKTQDRIDLLLYHTGERRLRYYEAKHYSNKELWRAEGSLPPVVKQIERYNQQIQKSKEQIIKAYGDYIDIINTLFDLEYEKPIDVEPCASLIVFGFDKDQRDGRLNKLLIEDGSLKGVRHKMFGDPKDVKISSIWNV